MVAPFCQPTAMFMFGGAESTKRYGTSVALNRTNAVNVLVALFTDTLTRGTNRFVTPRCGCGAAQFFFAGKDSRCVTRAFTFFAEAVNDAPHRRRQGIYFLFFLRNGFDSRGRTRQCVGRPTPLGIRKLKVERWVNS